MAAVRKSRNLEESRLGIESRLVALGRAHDFLIQENTAGAKLIDVIRSAIDPVQSHNGEHFIVQDADIDIRIEAVLPLTMFLNELSRVHVSLNSCVFDRPTM